MRWTGPWRGGRGGRHRIAAEGVGYALNVLLFLAAYCSDYWTRSGIIHFGLWRNCHGSRGCQPFQDDFVNDWLKWAGRSMTAAGLLHVLACLLLLQRYRQRRRHSALSLLVFQVLVTLAGTFNLVTVLLFHNYVFYPASIYGTWYLALFTGLGSLVLVILGRLARCGRVSQSLPVNSGGLTDAREILS